MQNITLYVLGFLFDESRQQVVLIQKEKPDWQRGLLNGVGGKAEPEESLLDAMVREFREETGVETKPEIWQPFCNLSGGGWSVLCFKAFSDGAFIDAKTQTEEQVGKFGLKTLEKYQTISNVPWLIRMALDENDGRPFFADVIYGKGAA